MDPSDRERRDPAEPSREEKQKQDEEGLSNLASAYQKAGPLMAASTQLVAAVGIFAWAGHWLDQKVGNRTPWFLLLGAALGMTGGFISFFRTVLGKKNK
ncbi:MAG: AtpZ/AtpI family protein [Deltaproteobacteria bacterium]|nr:AtpZ/AtpI family protein [Deltaproteobacteria bacterium]